MAKTRSTVRPAGARRPAAGRRPKRQAPSVARASAAGPQARAAKAKAPNATRRTAKAKAPSATRRTAKAKAPNATRRAPKRAPARASAFTATAQAVGRTLGRAASALAARVRPGAGTGDAIDLLEAEHRELEALLAEGEKTTARAGGRRRELLAAITDALTPHELIEEKVMYPALKSHVEARDIVLEGYQEHHVADVVLRELHGLPTSDERWGAKFKVFKENIEHHIEEEEGHMFKTARSVLSRQQLEALGTRMRRMKARARKTRR